jgi:D-alanine-D-alanine ligase
MLKIPKHIEIVRTNIVGLSSMSEKSCATIYSSLKRRYKTVGISTIDTINDLQELLLLQPDVAFLGMKFIPEDPRLGRSDTHKIWLADYLEKHGIAHTGSGSLAMERELDKQLAKERIANSGLATANFYVSLQSEKVHESKITLRYPLFVKPKDRGGGLGVDEKSIVANFAELQQKVASISRLYDSDSMIEEYLPGREFSVALLRDVDTELFHVMPLELVAAANDNGERVLSAELKTANIEQVLKVTEEPLKKQLSELALSAFHALGAQDYGRVDIRLDANGAPQFLEANLIPCLISGYGNFPKACAAYLGMNHESMIGAIVDLAMPNEPVELFTPQDFTLLPVAS